MIKVGVTGGIGSGKTTVCKLFENLGIPVYYADDRAKQLMLEDGKLKRSILETFGEESYTQAGQLNRAYLAERVFHSDTETQKLSGMVHPAVGKDFKEWLDIYKDEPIVMKEAAILFESGAHKGLDKIIVVDAPKEVRVERVLNRDPHRTREQIEAIMAKQMPSEQLLSRADYIIDNGGDLIVQDALDILKKLREE